MIGVRVEGATQTAARIAWLAPALQSAMLDGLREVGRRTHNRMKQQLTAAKVRDPFWGWMSLVHVSGGLVTVQNSPDMSGNYPIHVNKTKGGSWSVTVESIDDGMNNGTGAITVRNRFLFLGGNKLMVSDATLGDSFVTDNGDGTFTVDKNKEVVGVNLVFRITILQITKAG